MQAGNMRFCFIEKLIFTHKTTQKVKEV